MEPGSAPPGIVLGYTYIMSYPYDVNESLNVYDDGSVWYWSLRPAASEHIDRAGTFRFQLPDREFADLRALAEELVETPAEASTPDRNTIQIHVTANAGGSSQTHLLSAGSSPTMPQAAARAYEIGADLVKRAEDAPLAVVKLSWKPSRPVVSAGTPAHVDFMFENNGLKPVRVMAKPDAYTMYLVQPNGDTSQVWQGTRNLGTGIETEDGPSGMPGGDGFISPAQIPPGAKLRSFFRDALLLPGPGPVQIGTRVEGSITVYFPAGSGREMDEQYPNWPFRLESPPVEVTAV